MVLKLCVVILLELRRVRRVEDRGRDPEDTNVGWGGNCSLQGRLRTKHLRGSARIGEGDVLEAMPRKSL